VSANKWLLRQNAIKSLAIFIGKREVPPSTSEVAVDTSALLVLVKEHTRGFKESNLNVNRSILELFLSLTDFHNRAAVPFPSWTANEAATFSMLKIGDKKLSSLSKEVLTALCIVQYPQSIHASAMTSLQTIKSPLNHEEYLIWFKSFLNDFGAQSIGSLMKDVSILLSEVSL